MKLLATAIEPYTIDIPESVLNDLYKRLENTRWPQSPNLGWEGGMDSSYLGELCDYWREGYNWRNAEKKVNQLPHFQTEVDGIGIHFVYARGKGPAPFPLILTHGYPDSFYRFVKLVPLLTDPAAFGGRAEDAFDVVVPDIPGYGFSDKPDRRGSTFAVSDVWARLMTERLGYERFGAHGGDWGSTITEQLAKQHSGSVVAIHLTDVPFGHILRKPDDPSPAEQKLFKKNEQWLQKEGAYALIQSTKPQSLAPGLNDSPAGLAAWIVEKFRAWSDCGGDVESRFTRDELLTNVMIYWVTQSIGTSFLTYFDYANAGAMTWISLGGRDPTRSELTMLDNFTPTRIDTGETTIYVRYGGRGPAILLLHGFPQTHLMWRGVAPSLARNLTVVCADLRWYGHSGCPRSSRTHVQYSKRTMARDMLTVMEHLGFPRFSVVGHDRGGRVAYRLALDHADQIERLAVLDIVPTESAWTRADDRFALAFWPWSLLAQSEPFPEHVLTMAADSIIDQALSEWGTPLAVFSPEVRAAYIQALADPAHAHAICEEYRAAATIDREHDRTDRAASRRIACPLLVLWSAQGPLGTWYPRESGPVGLWQEWGNDVRGQPIEAGHFFPEEVPKQTAEALAHFFAS